MPAARPLGDAAPHARRRVVLRLRDAGEDSAAAVFLALVAACQGPSPERAGPFTQLDSEARDTVRAQELSREAADLIAADAPRAEKLLRDALSADLFYGPAHNIVGDRVPSGRQAVRSRE